MLIGFNRSNLVRIKGRLRNLIARRPQMETLKKSGIIQGQYVLSHLTLSVSTLSQIVYLAVN